MLCLPKILLSISPKVGRQGKEMKRFGKFNSVHCETPITLLLCLMRLFFYYFINEFNRVAITK